MRQEKKFRKSHEVFQRKTEEIREQKMKNEIALTHLYIMLRINESKAALFTKKGCDVPPELAQRIENLKTEILQEEKS